MYEIPTKEAINIEFKSDMKKYPDQDLVEAIVGLANTNGGFLYLGVEDDGKVTGLHKAHHDEIGLMALIANMTVPSIAVRAVMLKINEKDIMEIQVPMSRSVIATTSGKILKRRLKLDGTPENVPLYPHEINSRLSDLNLLDYSAQPIMEGTIEDFDPIQRVKLKNIIKLQRGEANLLELNDEELDKALGFVKEINGKIFPTVTGMLMIGKAERIAQWIPTAKSMFQVLEGTDIKKNESFIKPILASVEFLEGQIDIRNNEEELELGFVRIAIPDFDKAACREAIINAYCHRDYTILGSIRVLMDDEGITVSSPGGFIQGVNLNNLLTVEPHGRNQTLADALKRLGLAERTGRGVDRIYEGSIIYGRPLPDYSDSTSTMVRLFIQRSTPDYNFMKMIMQEQSKSKKKFPIYALLILYYLKINSEMTLRELIELLHINQNRIEANLEILFEAGLIEKIKDHQYQICEKVYPCQKKSKKMKISDYADKVMAFANKQQDSITREDVINLLNVESSQAYRILKKLVDQDKLVLVGKGKYAKYIIKK